MWVLPVLYDARKAACSFIQAHAGGLEENAL